MIHSPCRWWPILFPQTNPKLYSAVSACCGWKQVLEFIANCADFIENTRTGNGLLRILLFRALKNVEASCFFFPQKRVVQTKRWKLEPSSFYNSPPCCFLLAHAEANELTLNAKSHTAVDQKWLLPHDKLRNHNLPFCLKAVSGAIWL